MQLVGGVWPDGSWRVLVANLAEAPQALIVRRAPQALAVPDAGRDHELTIGPYEVVALDSHDA